MKPVSAYKCDWCNRAFMRRVTAASHECACNKNPARRHCRTCAHGVIGVTGQAEGPFDDGETFDVRGPVCDIHNKPIHEKPYLIECDYNTRDWGDEGEPVPGTCFYYEYKGYAGWKPPKRKV